MSAETEVVVELAVLTLVNVGGGTGNAKAGVLAGVNVGMREIGNDAEGSKVGSVPTALVWT